jgi:xanthine dehydrogenase iron-sulfur cluster and FAD-binding subunit A
MNKESEFFEGAKGTLQTNKANFRRGKEEAVVVELTVNQDMFAECGGSQCGFCTPGFLVASAALLDGNPTPTREEAMQAIEGNLCRCTGYQQIIDSIMSASKILSEGSQIQATTEPASDPHPNSRG